jgi:hypothetical protein
VTITARTLVNASDPEDIKKSNALQDKIMIKAASAKPYTHPNYDKASYESSYEALIQLGRGTTDFENSFGKYASKRLFTKLDLQRNEGLESAKAEPLARSVLILHISKPSAFQGDPYSMLAPNLNQVRLAPIVKR